MFSGVTIALIFVIILALAFDFINGFHDTANSIATTVSTRVLSPRLAILMAASLNFVGAIMNQKVAGTIANDIVDQKFINPYIVIAALIGAIVWNLITWYFGIPSSSSHALFGGIIGASVVYTAGTDILKMDGIVKKLIIPLFTSPLIGFFLGYLVMKLIYQICSKMSQKDVNKRFSKLQILSAAFMAYSHGNNDAQKSMGIITLALVAMNKNGGEGVRFEVVLACALAMALGTSVGGWKIIKTMGQNMIKLQPVQGFAAETSAAVIIETMTYAGAPVSTTHIISSSIMGVGASKRLSAVRWVIAKNILKAWILTIPAAILISGFVAFIFRLIV